MIDTMFSMREAPWMTMGKLVNSVTTAAEAAHLGGLDFEVVQRPLQWVDDNNVAHSIDDRRALIRADTNERLSIMSTSYPILQFSEAFDFMDGVDPRFIAAGTLKGGRQGFMIVEGPDMNVLNGDDPHRLFVVLRTSHDGSRAVEVAVMPLRDKCMNQLTLSSLTVRAQHRWAIRHTVNMQQKLADAHMSLERLDDYARGYERVAERLVDTRISDDTAEDILMTVLPDRPKRDDKITSIINKWHTAKTVGFDWTGWGLLNAVSEYFDWDRAHGTPESRFVGALQGTTHTMLNNVAVHLN